MGDSGNFISILVGPFWFFGSNNPGHKAYSKHSQRFTVVAWYQVHKSELATCYLKSCVLLTAGLHSLQHNIPSIIWHSSTKSLTKPNWQVKLPQLLFNNEILDLQQKPASAGHWDSGFLLGCAIAIADDGASFHDLPSLLQLRRVPNGGRNKTGESRVGTFSFEIISFSFPSWKKEFGIYNYLLYLRWRCFFFKMNFGPWTH